MKHSVAVKFIAIILCAAALMGIVASGAGIAMLTSMNLYKKTPALVRQETIENHGFWFASECASQYASRELGGCSNELLAQIEYIDPSYWFRAGYYGYTLRDADGNELWSSGIPAGENAETITFPEVTGKYRYLVSATPTAQPEATEAVDIPCQTLGLNQSQVTLATQGDTFLLVPVVSPSDTTDPIVYTSSNPAIASVDETGLITAHELGAVTITVSCGEITIPCTVVCEYPAETQPSTEAETLPPVVAASENAWDEDTWNELTQWVQDEWNMEQWNDGQWEPLSKAIAGSWNVDDWSSDQWLQLKRWIDTEFGDPAPTEETLEETTVPETTEATLPATEPTLSLRDLEAESRRLEAERETIPQEILVNGRPVTDYQLYRQTYFDSAAQQEMMAQFVMLDMPEYSLELRLLPGALSEDRIMPLVETLWMFRQLMVPILIGCLLLFAALAVYLVCAAGHKPGTDEVRAGGLNRIPLELYFGVVFLACVFAVEIVVETAMYSLDRLPLQMYLAMAGGIVYACSLLVVGFLFAAAAQIKSHIWLRQSLLGLCWRVLLWVWGKFVGLFPLILRWLKAGWSWVADGIRFAYVRFARLFAMLPMVWQWLIIGLAMLLGLVISVAGRYEGLLLICILADFLIVLYSAYAFGRLLDGTKRMSQGDLDTRIEDKHLLGGFRVFAQNLNALAGTAKTAAMKQLKSERMKTELITNVSHDIKTPLTSIVSYVDLLQKPHTEEEEQQYLEVLSRQSLTLKKLIEDLIEMSKASTGNMSVDIDLVDAVESVNQALGEFADKLDKAMLTPVFRHSQDTVPMMADGKLVWRVLHNLLSNAVKYALPGTRLYIDLMEVEGKVILSMKNVSREELNVDADELMERFVRGDDARNTEGSGLGLNIAKSMMELQKGQLQLLVDGDLFKVTLIFPGV